MARYPLNGSEHQPLPGAKSVGKADPSERLEVSLLLRRRDAAALKELVDKLASQANGVHPLSRQEFDRQFGADPAEIAAVRNVAREYGLSIVQEDAGRRTVVLSGTVAQFSEAFGVELRRFAYPGGSYRGWVGTLGLPDQLHGIVEAVLGLDSRPVASSHFQARAVSGNESDDPATVVDDPGVGKGGPRGIQGGEG